MFVQLPASSMHTTCTVHIYMHTYMSHRRSLVAVFPVTLSPLYLSAFVNVQANSLVGFGLKMLAKNVLFGFPSHSLKVELYTYLLQGKYAVFKCSFIFTCNITDMR